MTADRSLAPAASVGGTKVQRVERRPGVRLRVGEVLGRGHEGDRRLCRVQPIPTSWHVDALHALLEGRAFADLERGVRLCLAGDSEMLGNGVNAPLRRWCQADSTSETGVARARERETVRCKLRGVRRLGSGAALVAGVRRAADRHRRALGVARVAGPGGDGRGGVQRVAVRLHAVVAGEEQRVWGPSTFDPFPGEPLSCFLGLSCTTSESRVGVNGA